MAADMHMHILEGVTQDEYAIFNWNTLGSKYYDRNKDNDKYWIALSKKFNQTPNVWIGEVSWLKEALFEDVSCVPTVIEGLSKLIAEDFPVIDDALVLKVRKIYDDNEKIEQCMGCNIKNQVIDFLNQYKGKKVFLLNW